MPTKFCNVVGRGRDSGGIAKVGLELRNLWRSLTEGCVGWFARPLKIQAQWLPLVWAMLLASGCATDGPLEARGPVDLRTDSQCGPALSSSTARPPSRPTDTVVTAATTVPARLSPRALQMADILGVRELVRQIEESTVGASVGNETARITLLQARQLLAYRFILEVFYV